MAPRPGAHSLAWRMAKRHWPMAASGLGAAAPPSARVVRRLWVPEGHYASWMRPESASGRPPPRGRPLENGGRPPSEPAEALTFSSLTLPTCSNSTGGKFRMRAIVLLRRRLRSCWPLGVWGARLGPSRGQISHVGVCAHRSAPPAPHRTCAAHTRFVAYSSISQLHWPQ